MQAIPSVLFFIIPVFSVILLYIRLSARYASRSFPAESRDRSSRPVLSYIAFLSFGILSVISGSLGLAECIFESRGNRHSSLDAGEHVVVALIKFERK